MKKYLMLGVAALAFASCNKMEFTPSTQAEIDKAKYDAAFINTFGQPDANQTWGFGSATRGVTRGNSGDDYPATHVYKDAAGNVIAGANMNANEWADPDKNFGGWMVPDALTPGQKARVIAYFQANPKLKFEDPELRHFFVQQVYQGGSAQAGESTETITDANGTSYNSSIMNELSVGEANSHINNYNGGTYGTEGGASGVSVLNNGQHVGGTSHTDQITLMVNVDDTSCFGYKDSATGGTQHNNKMALVSAADIDAWAAANGNPGEAVSDKWNRSFLGFDLALLEGDQAYAKNADGDVLYATYDQAPTSPIYGWDGEKVVLMVESSVVTHEESWGSYTETVYGDYLDEYKTIMNIGWLTTNKNFYNAADAVTLTGEYNNGELEQTIFTAEGMENVLVFKDVKVPGAQNNKAHVINLKRIKDLVDDGYLPVMNKSLTEWVKVGKSDGYFTDWIVTLSPAERVVIDTNTEIRIIAEDLSASSASDFDFNDVVLDVVYGDPATVTLQAAGGTLPLRIRTDDGKSWEVHHLFGVWVGDENFEKTKKPERQEMVNTGAGPDKDPVVITDFATSIADAAESNTKIHLEVYKGGEWQEMTAVQGEPASKLGVDKSFHWLGERVSIKGSCPLFVDWVNGTNPSYIKWW